VCFDLLNSLARRRSRRISHQSRTYASLTVQARRFALNIPLTRRHTHRPAGILSRLESNSSLNDKEPFKALPEAQQTAYARLRPIIDTFEAPIEWAVAYGSGVVHQANEALGVRHVH